MASRRLGLITAFATGAVLSALPASAQVTGYETPTPLPTFFETDPPSEPPSDPPSEEPSVPPSEPPPTVPPGPPPSDPPPDVPNDPPDPNLPATGLGVTNGMAAAGVFLAGGTGLVLVARRRRSQD